jgi:hypothetical protein
MSIFKNIFDVIDANTRINFSQLTKIRRSILEREGLDTGRINWELYTKILEAKHENMKKS